MRSMVINTKGFSLVELLAVLAIMGVLLTLAGLSGRNLLERYRVEGEVRTLYADLMNARVRAMQTNRMYFVRVLAKQYSIYQDTNPAPDGNGTLETTAPKDTLFVQKTISDTFTISNADSFDFDKNGMAIFPAVTTPRVIRVATTAGPEYDCLEISTTRVRTGRWNGTICQAK